MSQEPEPQFATPKHFAALTPEQRRQQRIARNTAPDPSYVASELEWRNDITNFRLALNPQIHRHPPHDHGWPPGEGNRREYVLDLRTRDFFGQPMESTAVARRLSERVNIHLPENSPTEGQDGSDEEENASDLEAEAVASMVYTQSRAAGAEANTAMAAAEVAKALHKAGPRNTEQATAALSGFTLNSHILAGRLRQKARLPEVSMAQFRAMSEEQIRRRYKRFFGGTRMSVETLFGLLEEATGDEEKAFALHKEQIKVRYKRFFDLSPGMPIETLFALLQEADCDEEKSFTVHKALISALDTAEAGSSDFQELPGEIEEALAEAKAHNKKGALTSEIQAPQSDLAREFIQMPKTEFKERITNILKQRPGALEEVQKLIEEGKFNSEAISSILSPFMAGKEDEALANIRIAAGSAALSGASVSALENASSDVLQRARHEAKLIEFRAEFIALSDAELRRGYHLPFRIWPKMTRRYLYFMLDTPIIGWDDYKFLIFLATLTKLIEEATKGDDIPVAAEFTFVDEDEVRRKYSNLFQEFPAFTIENLRLTRQNLEGANVMLATKSAQFLTMTPHETRVKYNKLFKLWDKLNRPFLHNILADEHVEWDEEKAATMITELRGTLEANGATAIEEGIGASGGFVFVKKVEDEGRRSTTGPSASASDAIQTASESTAEWPLCQSITERASPEASAAAESKITASSTGTPSSASTGSTALTTTTGISVTSPLTLEPTKSLCPGSDNGNANTLTGSLNECFKEPPSEPSPATRQATLDRTETPHPSPTPRLERATSDFTSLSGGRDRRRNPSIDIDAPPAAQAFISQLLALGLREVPAKSQPQRTQVDSDMLGQLPPPAPLFGSRDPQRATLDLTETPPPPAPTSGAVDPFESAYQPPFRGRGHVKSDYIDSDDIPDNFDVAQLAPAPAPVGANISTLDLPETLPAPTRTAAIANVFGIAFSSPSTEKHLARSPSVERDDIPERFEIGAALPASNSVGVNRSTLDLSETLLPATSRSGAVNLLGAAFRPPAAEQSRARTTFIHKEFIPDTVDNENDDNISEASSIVGKLLRAWAERGGVLLENDELPAISLEPSIVNAVSDIMATLPAPLSGSAAGPAPRSPSRGRTLVKRGSMDVEDQPQNNEGVDDWLVGRGHSPLRETSIEPFVGRSRGSLNELDVLAAKLKKEVEEWTKASTRPDSTQTPQRSSCGTLNVELSNAVQVAHNSAEAGDMPRMRARVNTYLSERGFSPMPKNSDERRERSFEEMQERASVLTAAVADYNRDEGVAAIETAPPPSSSSASGYVKATGLAKKVLGGQNKTSWNLRDKKPQRSLEEVEARAAALGAALEESITAKAASASTKTPAQSSSSGIMKYASDASKLALEGLRNTSSRLSDDDLPPIVSAIKVHLKSSGLKERTPPSASALYDGPTPSDFALGCRLNTPDFEYVDGNAEDMTVENLSVLGFKKVPTDKRQEYFPLAASTSTPNSGSSSSGSLQAAARSRPQAATEQKLVDERLKVQLLKASKLKAEERVGAMNAVLTEMVSEQTFVDAFNAGNTEGTIATQMVGEIYKRDDQAERSSSSAGAQKLGGDGSSTSGGAGSSTAALKKDKGKGREMTVAEPENLVRELVVSMLKGYAKPEPGSERDSSPIKDKGKGKEKEAVKAALPPMKTYIDKVVADMSKRADLDTSATSSLGAPIATQDKVPGNHKLVKSMPAQDLSADAVASLMKTLDRPNSEDFAHIVSAEIRSPDSAKRKGEKVKEKDDGKMPGVIEVTGVHFSQGLVKTLANIPSGNGPKLKVAGQELSAEVKNKRKGPSNAADEGGSAAIIRAAAMIVEKRKKDKREAAASAKINTGSQGLGGVLGSTTPQKDKDKRVGTRGREGAAPSLPSGARDTDTLEKALAQAASACNSSLRAAEQDLNKPDKDKEMTAAAIAAAGELTATVRAAKMVMEKRKKDTEVERGKGPAGADSGTSRLAGAQKVPETSKKDKGKGPANEVLERHGLGGAPVQATQKKDEENEPAQIAAGTRISRGAKMTSTLTMNKANVPEDGSSAWSATPGGAVQNSTTLANYKGEFPAVPAADISFTPGSRGAESHALTTKKDKVEAPTGGFDLDNLLSPAELREQEMIIKTLFSQAATYGAGLRAAEQNSKTLEKSVGMTPAQAPSANKLAATVTAAHMGMEQGEMVIEKGTGSPDKATADDSRRGGRALNEVTLTKERGEGFGEQTRSTRSAASGPLAGSSAHIRLSAAQLTWRESCRKKDKRIDIFDQIDLPFTGSESSEKGSEQEVEELAEGDTEAPPNAECAKSGRSIFIDTDETPDTFELEEGSIRLDTSNSEDEEVTPRKYEVKAPANRTPVIPAVLSAGAETPTSPCSAASDPSTSSLGRLTPGPPSSPTKNDEQRSGRRANSREKYKGKNSAGITGLGGVPSNKTNEMKQGDAETWGRSISTDTNETPSNFEARE